MLSMLLICSCDAGRPANQHLVVEEALALLDAEGLAGILFEAFREPWKARDEGPIGAYWGVCSGELPYTCPSAHGMRWRVSLPLALVGRP